MILSKLGKTDPSWKWV